MLACCSTGLDRRRPPPEPPDHRDADRMSVADELATDPPTAPTLIPLSQSHHQHLHRTGNRRPAWPPAALAAVPLDRDEPAAPHEQSRGRDREHPHPSTSREHHRQHSESDPPRRLAPHRTGDLPAQHRIRTHKPGKTRPGHGGPLRLNRRPPPAPSGSWTSRRAVRTEETDVGHQGTAACRERRHVLAGAPHMLPDHTQA